MAALPAIALAFTSARRSPIGWAAGVIIALGLAGLALDGLSHPPPPLWPGRPEREARLSLRIDRVFPPAPKGRAASGLATVTRADPHLQDLVGQRIYFSLTLRRGAAPPDRSARVAVIGLLAPVPAAAPAGSFGASLAAEGLGFRLTRGRLLATEVSPTAYRRFCGRMADWMTILLGIGLERHPDLRALYGAMLLGRKRDLSLEQQQLFLRAGAMHLFAVNGIHIGTVALALHALFALARCPRPVASVLVLAALWLDVDTTGASPSAVRAFLMAAAAEGAWVLRRPANPLASLAAAALLILLIAPTDFFSASFQMSYGVMTGLATLGLPLAAHGQEWLAPNRYLPRAVWNRRQRLRGWMQHHLLDGLGFGAAAAAIGAITGVEFFHLFVPGGLAANLALVPPALLVIVAGVGALACGFAHALPATRFCNGAAAMVLLAMTSVAKEATTLPGVYAAAQYRAPWIGPLSLAILLAACLAGYALDWRPRWGGFWPPFLVVFAALSLGVRYG